MIRTYVIIKTVFVEDLFFSNSVCEFMRYQKLVGAVI